MRLTLLAVVLLSCLLPLAPVHAYPISPQTLWELTRQAQLVVLVEVETLRQETRASESNGDVIDFENGFAHLRVLETWKGPRLERLVIPYTDGVVCPAPPVFVAGKRAVVFLEEDDEEKGHWYVTGLSYGTRYPSDARAEEAYRDAVLDAVELQARAEAERPRVAPEPPVSPVQERADGTRVIVLRSPRAPEPITAERLDWQVHTALHPETRWDGLYGLAPETDIHWRYDRHPRAKAPPLSALQLELLAQAFAASPALDASLPMMLAVLGTYRSPEVDAALASALEELLREEPLGEPKSVPTWAATAMDHLATRLGRPPTHGIRTRDALFEEFAELGAGFEEMDRRQSALRRREWAQLKRELCLSPTPRKHGAPETPWGVGGNTPL